MDFYVYVHRRATDGSVFYVGKGHGRRAYEKGHRNPHWNRTVAKHGYTIEIVKDGMEENEAFKHEIELIAEYGRKNLCNMTDGGDGFSGGVWTEEARKKMSAIHKGKIVPRHIVDHVTRLITGKKRTEETKRKIGNYHRGKIVSAETRKKQSIARTGLKQKQSTIDARVKKCSKAVECSNGMTFSSAAAAERWLRSNGYPTAYAANISKAVNGHKNSYLGLKWSFVHVNS